MDRIKSNIEVVIDIGESSSTGVEDETSSNNSETPKHLSNKMAYANIPMTNLTNTDELPSSDVNSHENNDRKIKQKMII